MEIEKKYLLKDTFNLQLDYLAPLPSVRIFNIEQFYISEDGKDTRYRSRNGTYFRTIKSGRGLVREEFEEEIEEDEFRKAEKLSEKKMIGKIVSKNRYVANIEGFTYELDVFKNELDGLVLLEIEFETEEEAFNHSLPEKLKRLVIRDVTEESAYVNLVLAKEGLPK